MAYRDTLNQQTNLLIQQNLLLNTAFLQACKIHPMITVVWIMFLVCITPFLLAIFTCKVLSFAVFQFDKACELKAARDRLAMLEAEHERELALRRSTWDAARQQQEAQLERLPEQREARLNAVREQVALDGARSLASARLELEQARSAAVERAAAASQEAADRISAAKVTRDTDLALASSQLERKAAELGAFRVELDGLAQGGESSVRAALIQALAGVTVDLQSPRTEVELGSAGRARPSSHVSQEL